MPTSDEKWPEGTPCWVDCQVAEPDTAQKFYESLFGWQIFDSGPDGGGYLMCYLQDKPVAGIGQLPPGAPAATWTTYLSSDDVHATADAVEKAGGSILAPPMDVLTAGRMAVGVDPAGASFGIWEALDHKGVGIFNEAGALCWNELHTTQYKKVQEFYKQVFGLNFQEIGDEHFTYSVFTVGESGTTESIGGCSEDSSIPDGHPPYWLTWFAVDDCDEAITRATSLDSKVVMEPMTTPFGRMGIVRAPQGEVFGLIDLHTRVGETPAGAPVG